MLGQRKLNNGKRRRAAVAVQLAMVLPVLLGFTALTVDVGAMYNAKAELQRTADAAALAAASMLAEFEEGDPVALGREAALEYAARNTLFGQSVLLDPQLDVVFGRADYSEEAGEYIFTPTEVMPDSVRVTARFTEDSPNGPLPLYFAALLGKGATDVWAQATAIMVPRDIAIVADLSGSMNDDSELRNVHKTQINMFSVWANLPLSSGKAGIGSGHDPADPGQPQASDLHPTNGPGLPGHVGGNPNENNEPFEDTEEHGPRWGWMTGWGSEIELGSYNPAADDGVYYIPRYQTCTDPAVIQNLVEAGYSWAERTALLSGSNDDNSTYYRNRVRALLGLAGWDSGKPSGKYTARTGDGNGTVGSGELTQTVDYPFDSGSWNTYVDYVSSSSTAMERADSRFRYRYGIKTFTNYLLENKCRHAHTPELAGTPAQPAQAVKDAVAHMVEVIEALETDDQVSLEIYGETVHHEHDLTYEYQDTSGRLQQMQAGHYDTWTNMGGGIDQAIQELTESGRQREVSRKIMILLTDGNANVNEEGGTGDTYGGGQYALAQAQRAADLGIRIFAVSHGYSADQDIMDRIAEIGSGEHYHAEGSIEQYSAQLDEIFNRLGGKRPVELIE